MNDDGENTDPVDLNRRKLAMEVEKELGGLFGIGLQDIERALGRLYGGKISLQADSGSDLYSELPEQVRRSMHFLEGVSGAAEELFEQENYGYARMILELLEHHRDQLKARLSD